MDRPLIQQLSCKILSGSLFGTVGPVLRTTSRHGASDTMSSVLLFLIDIKARSG